VHAVSNRDQHCVAEQTKQYQEVNERLTNLFRSVLFVSHMSGREQEAQLDVVLDAPLLLLVLLPLHASKVAAHRLLVLVQREISAGKKSVVRIGISLDENL
jgi:hypothetical protein